VVRHLQLRVQLSHAAARAAVRCGARRAGDRLCALAATASRSARALRPDRSALRRGAPRSRSRA
jgi:hypothetical protein